MRSEIWISLFNRFPPERIAKLSIVTVGGNEINVQTVFHIEDEYVVMRGRQAGTTDEPRVLMLPLDQIEFMSFRDVLKDTDVESIFGAASVARPGPKQAVAPPPEPVKQAAAPQAAPASAPTAPAPATAPGQPPAAAPPAAVPAAAGSNEPLLPGKAALLERLRKSRQGQKPG